MSIKYNRDDTVAERLNTGTYEHGENRNAYVATLWYARKSAESTTMNSGSTYKYTPSRHCRVYATMNCRSSGIDTRHCRVTIAGKLIGIFGTSTGTNTNYPEQMQVNGPILDLWPGDEVTFQAVSGSTSFTLILNIIPFRE